MGRPGRNTRGEKGLDRWEGLRRGRDRDAAARRRPEERPPEDINRQDGTEPQNLESPPANLSKTGALQLTEGSRKGRVSKKHHVITKLLAVFRKQLLASVRKFRYAFDPLCNFCFPRGICLVSFEKRH